MQGTQTLNAFIYLWMRDARVVVSEVSGIITRSDVLGVLSSRPAPAAGR